MKHTIENFNTYYQIWNKTKKDLKGIPFFLQTSAYLLRLVTWQRCPGSWARSWRRIEGVSVTSPAGLPRPYRLAPQGEIWIHTSVSPGQTGPRSYLPLISFPPQIFLSYLSLKYPPHSIPRKPITPELPIWEKFRMLLQFPSSGWWRLKMEAFRYIQAILTPAGRISNQFVGFNKLQSIKFII